MGAMSDGCVFLSSRRGHTRCLSDWSSDVCSSDLFLQAGLLTLPADDREGKYGRALGRVLAHELYHIFANTMRHGSVGVAKESYSVLDLLSDDFQFQAKETKMLQSSRPKPAVEITPGTM